MEPVQDSDAPGQQHRRAPHPNSLANLAPPWPDGVSGNPGGRPKGASQRAVLYRRMAESPNDYGEGALAVERAEAIIAALKSGDKDALERELKFLAEYEPAIREKVQHQGFQVLEAITIEDRRSKGAT